MDWNGDHPHTNFRSLHGALRRAGFHVEALSGNFSSFDASRYGAARYTEIHGEIGREGRDISQLQLLQRPRYPNPNPNPNPDPNQAPCCWSTPRSRTTPQR